MSPWQPYVSGQVLEKLYANYKNVINFINNYDKSCVKLKMNNNYTRFNMELPGDSRMDALLDKVEAGQVRARLVNLQIRFEEERIICEAETWWECKDTGKRGHCKGQLQ